MPTPTLYLVPAEPQFSRAEERELILAAQQGDQAASLRLLASIERLIFSIAWRETPPGCDVEDYQQVARIAVLQNIPRFAFEYNTKFSSFMQPQIRGACQKHTRRTRYRLRREPANFDLLTDGRASLEYQQRRTEQRAILAELLPLLSPLEAAVVQLRFLEGYKMREISQQRQMSMEVIWQACGNGLRKLRRLAAKRQLSMT